MALLNPAIAEKLGNLNSTILSGHHLYNDTNSDEYLKRRFSSPTVLSHNITYEATHDESLIRQYLNIRESAYREMYNDNNASLDFFDSVSEVIVARSGNNVIGGMRVTISSPENRIMLPIESHIDFKRAFPTLDLTDVTYGEATRQAVLPDFRKGEVSTKIQQKSLEHAMSIKKVEISFGCAPITQTRRLSAMFRRMGYKFVYRADCMISVPGSEAQLFLWAVDFTDGGVYEERLMNGHQDSPFMPVLA